MAAARRGALPCTATAAPERCGPPWQLVAAGLLAAAFAVYGRHLGDGLLSDDFGYAALAGESPWTLLRHLTTESNPRVLRPLPGLPWLLLRLGGGATLLHLISVALHGTNSALLAWSARRTGAAPALAALLGLLFCAFPLFGEPVIWLSCGFDLWATCFALATTLLLTNGLTTDTAAPGAALAAPRAALAVTAFVCALLSKECAFLLPVALLGVLPTAHRRRLIPIGGSAAIYLGVRLILFHGLGGYQTPGARALPEVHPLRFAGEVLYQIPLRTLVPLKLVGTAAAAVAVGSVTLAAALARAEGARRWVRPGLCAAAVFAVSLLPAVTVLHIRWDQQGSRCLYLPVACALVALGRHLRRVKGATLVLGTVLAVAWGAVAVANGRAWTRAAYEARTVIAAMRRCQGRFPSGATVVVAAPDTLAGAYVFRNGLPQAAALNGLRTDLRWVRDPGPGPGTPAAGGAYSGIVGPGTAHLNGMNMRCGEGPTTVPLSLPGSPRPPDS